MKNFGNCRGCGKAIAYDMVCMCAECHRKYYGPIKNFLSLNRFATSEEVAKALNIPVTIVEYYKKKDLIQMASKEMITRRQQLAQLNAKEALRGIKNEEKKEPQMYKVVGKYHFLTPDRIRSSNR